jgi:hypothetical protein
VFTLSSGSLCFASQFKKNPVVIGKCKRAELRLTLNFLLFVQLNSPPYLEVNVIFPYIIEHKLPGKCGVS